MPTWVFIIFATIGVVVSAGMLGAAQRKRGGAGA